MTAASIRASAAYRKRQAAKLVRYREALERIAAPRYGPIDFVRVEDMPGVIARAALQEPSDA